MAKLPPGVELRHVIREAHAGLIHNLAWSPDGQNLATSSEDGTIRLWDSKTGELYRELIKHSSDVRCLTWSPDGHTLASGSDDETILFWDIQTKLIFRQCKEHYGLINSIAWSPDGRAIASGCDDGTIMIWSRATWKPRWHYMAHRGSVTSLAWSPDGRTLASISRLEPRRESQICLWDRETKEPRWKLTTHAGQLSSLCWSPDGQMIASGLVERTIGLWDAKRRMQTNALKGHKNVVTSLSFSSDGCLLASKSMDSTIRLWRSDTWQEVAMIKETSNYSTGLAFNPHQSLLASIDQKHRAISIWEIDFYFGNKQSAQTTEAGLASVGQVMHTDRFKNWAGSAQAILSLLFTDVVGATSLGNEVGNELMNDIRRAHFNQTQSLLEKYDGFKIKTGGDSFFIAFRTAVEALNFALALNKNTGHPLVKIRTGIHVGMVLIEEEDAFSTAVNYTHRVMEKGGASEIWISERAKADIVEARSHTHELLDWQLHTDCTLHGFAEKQKLWSVFVGKE